VNHRPLIHPVGLCLDSKEDSGATEHLAVALWSKWESGLENVMPFLSRAYRTLSSLSTFTIYTFSNATGSNQSWQWVTFCDPRDPSVSCRAANVLYKVFQQNDICCFLCV